MKQTLSAQNRILDISVNLGRIGNWTADAYSNKKHLINHFMDQTQDYLKEIAKVDLSDDVKPVIEAFKVDFDKLKNEKVTDKNKNLWAERALTWANILQHRAKLA